MAFDQSTRNRLQRFVTDARRTLELEFTRQLQNDYGLDPISGTASPLESLRHINDQQRETARILRDTLAHYCASVDTDTKAGLDRIVREQAFTVLNRLAALRMAEARGLLMESVGNGYQAKGFQLYARLAGTGLGEAGDAYRVYLQSVFDELSQDLPGLFDRYSPQGRLFPREAALIQVLTLINDGEIEPLWSEDETIGWIYQYFNSKEERKAMRDASQAPRNSRELAVRNQFFTPRYVVEFLVDNTLGRLWFNWTGGQTCLRDRCQYLLVKPDEQPEPATRLRDPRTIKLLDPACGSMHFGLYAFDLFLEIYREAWAWEQTHGPGCLDTETGGNADLKPLSQTYADQEAFLHDVPRLIIEHNIYGVDIDPRAAQIASLALWLRAQRAWHEAGVKAKDRPQVGRGNVVAAVAPPAEVDLRKRFMEELDPLDAELFEKTLFLLKGLPELGVLLQVEKELPALVRAVFGEHGDLFRDQDMAQWQKAETRLREALTEFARAARSNYQGRLFAEDALQGLRIVDLCQEKFDVALMNPPFGEPSNLVKAYCDQNFDGYNKNLLCAFLIRCFSMLRQGGTLGAIYDRTAAVKNSYEAFRREFLLKDDRLSSQLDLGWGVLDANVEVTCSIIQNFPDSSRSAAFMDARSEKPEAKESYIFGEISTYCSKSGSSRVREYQPSKFLSFPNAVLGYDFPEFVVEAFASRKSVNDAGLQVIAGHTIKSERYFRYWWEVPLDRAFDKNSAWQRFYNGGEYCRFVSHLCDAVYYGSDGELIADNASTIFRNLSRQGRGKLGFGKRGEYIDAHVLPSGFVSSVEGQAVLLHEGLDPFGALALINSRLFQFLINMYCGQHKYPGYVHLLPEPSWNSDAMINASSKAASAFNLKESFETADETSPLFFGGETRRFWHPEFIEEVFVARGELDKLEHDINCSINNAYGFSDDAQELIFQQTAAEPTTGGVLDSSGSKFWAINLVHFLIGCAFGRWDIRLVKDPNLQKRADPFESLPVSPPAWLGLYSAISKMPYPISVADFGIIGTDAAVGRGFSELIGDALQYIYSDGADSIETQILRELEHRSLSEYLAKSSGFFSDHLQKYSKGRRQAPIYWPISTSTGGYTLWLYYPSLTDQTLFSAVNDFIVPKLKQVGQDVVALRTKGSTRSRDDEKTFEALQALELELIELRDTLLGIAQTYRPNHDDGVQITAAPLWQLFRHKSWQEALKDTWAKLEKGDYDWAHLAMAYWPDRVREKCKTDKSLAIAHHLEHLYVEPEPTKARGRKKDG